MTVGGRGSNAFRNLEVPRGEIAHRKLRADLMAEVTRIIRERNLPLPDAARLFAETQPRLKDVMAGKVELFSLDGLVEMLDHAGVRVTFRAPRPRR